MSAPLSPEKIASVLGIHEDKDFVTEASKLLEGSPHGQKGLPVIKLNTVGKVAKKQLYLSLAHGTWILILNQ